MKTISAEECAEHFLWCLTCSRLYRGDHSRTSIRDVGCHREDHSPFMMPLVSGAKIYTQQRRPPIVCLLAVAGSRRIQARGTPGGAHRPVDETCCNADMELGSGKAADVHTDRWAGQPRKCRQAVRSDKRLIEMSGEEDREFERQVATHMCFGRGKISTTSQEARSILAVSRCAMRKFPVVLALRASSSAKMLVVGERIRRLSQRGRSSVVVGQRAFIAPRTLHRIALPGPVPGCP